MSDWGAILVVGATILIAVFTGGIFDRLAAIKRTLDVIADNTFDPAKEREKRDA